MHQLLVAADCLPVVGWTMGIATWEKSRQDRAVFVFSFVGVDMSGEFSQTHLVSKVIASCEIMFCRRTPPLIGTNRMCGRRIGAAGFVVDKVLGDCLKVVGQSWGCISIGCQVVIGGTLPGTLFRVHRECVHLVSFNACLVVGFRAVMIEGALVIRVSEGAKLIVSFVAMSVHLTLCSTLCSGGGTYGTL
jgi:hypothetical protein